MLSFTISLSLSLISNHSAAQEKLAIWLVAVVETAAAVEFVACFYVLCLGFACLFIYHYLGGGGGALAELPPPPPWIHH